ncbi:hypothetical protein [Streptomyces sp. NPDC057429]|uniref:hypothetical protein n=1 Tax=Streptomyces sp. NPDC057429 TaxID=3346130 RepID=UPI0036AF0FB8
MAVEDLAAEYEIDPEALDACLQGTRPEGWHLALSAEGEAGYGLTLLPTETDAWRALLERDELYDEAASSFDTVRVLPATCLTADELAALVLGEEPGQDALVSHATHGLQQPASPGSHLAQPGHTAAYGIPLG